MSGSSRPNNDYTTFANFLLSAGIVTAAGARNYGGNVAFLQHIGFCSIDAQTIARALVAAANLISPPITPGHVPSPHRSGGGPSPNLGGPVTVPLGWLVGSPRVQAGQLPLTAISSPLTPSARFP